MRAFVEEWVLNPRKKSTERKIDKIRGEFPYDMASGYGLVSAGAATILTVPSGFVFNTKMIYVFNGDTSAEASLWIYDGGGTSVPIFPVLLATATQKVLGENELHAVLFKSTVRVSVDTSAVRVRVGGFLYEAD